MPLRYPVHPGSALIIGTRPPGPVKGRIGLSKFRFRNVPCPNAAVWRASAKQAFNRFNLILTAHFLGRLAPRFGAMTFARAVASQIKCAPRSLAVRGTGFPVQT